MKPPSRQDRKARTGSNLLELRKPLPADPKSPSFLAAERAYLKARKRLLSRKNRQRAAKLARSRKRSGRPRVGSPLPRPSCARSSSQRRSKNCPTNSAGRYRGPGRCTRCSVPGTSAARRSCSGSAIPTRQWAGPVNGVCRSTDTRRQKNTILAGFNLFLDSDTDDMTAHVQARYRWRLNELKLQII